VALIEANGSVVSKDELISRVWPGRVIEEGNLRAQIRALRMTLGDPDLIRTVAGRGYQFTGEVRRSDGRGQGSIEQEAAGATPAAAPRLSIVVLPFANLSDNREQQYFADGITEDLTTDLSRLADMLVISRNTAFTYRNSPLDTKQIGRELRVRYVLEGSVRRSGSQVRVSAQLINAETDAHLWAERFDSDLGDLIAVQNEITSRIAVAINVELVGAEATRPALHFDALDYVLLIFGKGAHASQLRGADLAIRARSGARSGFREGAELSGVAVGGARARSDYRLGRLRPRTCGNARRPGIDGVPQHRASTLCQSPGAASAAAI
jgi:TolB-like protein